MPLHVAGEGHDLHAGTQRLLVFLLARLPGHDIGCVAKHQQIGDLDVEAVLDPQRPVACGAAQARADVRGEGPQPLHLRERLFDRLEPLRPDYGDNQLHPDLPRCIV